MSIILQITQHHYLTSNLLAELLSRKTSTLRKRYLSKLVKDGYLTLAYPNTPTHKNQAYRTTSKGAAWLNAQTDKKTN